MCKVNKVVPSIGLLIILAMVGMMVTSETGCAFFNKKKTQVVNVPTGVNATEVANWYAATGAAHALASTTSGITTTLITVHGIKVNGQPAIPDEQYQMALLVVGKVAQVGLNIDQVLRKTPNKFDATTKSQVAALLGNITDQVKAADLEGTFSRSQNPQMQAELTQVQLLEATLSFMLNATN